MTTFPLEAQDWRQPPKILLWKKEATLCTLHAAHSVRPEILTLRQ